MTQFSDKKEMPDTFDLSDLCDLNDTVPETSSEVEQWASEVVEKAVAKDQEGKPVIFDVETGPRPIEEIESFYPVPASLPSWDESMVKYGNAKREELREQKRREQEKAHQDLLDRQDVGLAEHKAAWLDKAALSPVTGRVLLVGTLIGGKPWFFDCLDEKKLLESFWRLVDELLTNKTPLIGHNSNGFDLPFLVRRSWCLGVLVPREVRQGRYWNPLFRDTMETWNCGAREYVKLDLLGQFFGVGQKTEGVAGGDFYKLWFGTMPADQWGTAAEQRAKAIEYNGQDLTLTAAVAAKMGMV